MPEVMIELKKLKRIYPKTHAGLGPISLQIQPGEWITVLGPSGSGKSTLLRLISGLDTRTEGELIQDYSRKEMGFVFQDSALLPWKTVLENIVLPLELRGMSIEEARNRASPWIEKLKLSQFIRAFPSELSGGLRMRVSLARALITDPKLLLLDEPFSALDEPIRIELGLELRALWKSLKPTVVLVTHSITEGVWLGDRVLVIRGQPGSLVMDQKIELGMDRSLTQRAHPEFLKIVKECYELLKGV